MTAIKEELADTYFSSSLFRIANVDTVDMVIYHTITLLVKDILCYYRECPIRFFSSTKRNIKQLKKKYSHRLLT